jgi:hypothetical protein
MTLLSPVRKENMNSISSLKPTRERVLDLSMAEKIRYFKGVIVRHPRMESAIDDVLTLADSGTNIILLIGPSGVGKTAALFTAEQKIIAERHDDMEADPSLIPVVFVEAQETGEQGFSWRVLYEDIGEKLNEPLIDRKMETVIQDGRWRVHIASNGGHLYALRTSVVKALKHRHTMLLAIDEAVHIKKSHIKRHMNALKSLSNVSGLALCLVGSYDLRELLNLSGQVARRAAFVHMERYRVGNKSDEATFAKIVRTLTNQLPLPDPPNLGPRSLVLQRACIGCTGTLKDTLMRALVICLKKGGKWKDSYLARALLSEAAAEKIFSETSEGERALEHAIYGRRSLEEPDSA